MRRELDDLVEMVKVGYIDEVDNTLIHANICGVIPSDYRTGRFHEPLIYQEFIKVIGEGYTITDKEKWFGRGGEYRTGSGYSGLEVGVSMTLMPSRMSDGVITSVISKIVTENLFITNNYVYFLNTPEWRKKVLREEKLENILK